MEHAPIYRSSAHRASTSLLPWRRTASLTSASIALTLSGIVLGYQGFTTTAASGPPMTGYSNSTRLETTGAGRSADPRVPTVSISAPEGGHPDIMTRLSSALIAQFEAAQVPILASPIGPLLEPLMGPPSPAGQGSAIQPMWPQPRADRAELSLDLAAPPLVEDLGASQVSEPVVLPEIGLGPAAPIRALPPVAVEVAPAITEAPVLEAAWEQPQEAGAPVVEPDAPVIEAQASLEAPVVEAAAAPATLTGESPAPQRAAAVAHQAAPAPAKHTPPPPPPADEDAQPVQLKHAAPAPPDEDAPAVQVQSKHAPAPAPDEDAQPIQVQPKQAPPPARANNNNNNNSGNNDNNPAQNQQDQKKAHGSDTKANPQPAKGKGGSQSSDNGKGQGSDHGKGEGSDHGD